MIYGQKNKFLPSLLVKKKKRKKKAQHSDKLLNKGKQLEA